MKKTLPADVELTTAYDRTQLVDQVIHTVHKNLFEGGLLVIAVLFIFLGNLRAGLIVALAIPISMLFAFCGMWRFRHRRQSAQPRRHRFRPDGG